MAKGSELRVWTLLLSVESQADLCGVSYEIWAHDAAQAAKLALADAHRRGESVRGVLQCEIGPILARQNAEPQVRLRVSQRARFVLHGAGTGQTPPPCPTKPGHAAP